MVPTFYDSYWALANGIVSHMFRQEIPGLIGLDLPIKINFCNRLQIKQSPMSITPFVIIYMIYYWSCITVVSLVENGGGLQWSTIKSSYIRVWWNLLQKGGGTLTEVQSLYYCKPSRIFFGDSLALLDISYSIDSEPYASPGLSEYRRRNCMGDFEEVL